MPEALTAASGTSLVLNIKRADNQVACFVNTTLAYTKKTDGDPAFDDTRDLTGLLSKGRNIVLVLAVNWGGPYHFNGSLKLGDRELIGVDEKTDKGNGIVNYWAFEIIVP